MGCLSCYRHDSNVRALRRRDVSLGLLYTHKLNSFAGAVSFNKPLAKWSVGNVEDMTFMFAGAKTFNKSLQKWDVSKVQVTFGMFSSARAFKKSLCSWGDKLPITAFVNRMFKNAKACASQKSPNLAADVPGPFCQQCQ